MTHRLKTEFRMVARDGVEPPTPAFSEPWFEYFQCFTSRRGLP
jgi:hypothetical protein